MQVESIEHYVNAATRENTRRSYRSAVRHFEVEWGGHLPASSQQVAQYLTDHAGRLSINTLRQRLAALARWHADHGFGDPTRNVLVRDVLKGIRHLHPATESRAAPLPIAQLEQVMRSHEITAKACQEGKDRVGYLRALRDRALVSLGFWRGFRGDELLALQSEHLRIVSGEGMTCFLPHTKADRQNRGTTFKVPALSRCCAVAATQDWIAAAFLTEGPLFQRIDRWGRLSNEPLHPNSLIPLLRRAFAAAELPAPESYSGHSLRRGFAAWADAQGWDARTLMAYVGWKDLNSAMRYIDGADPFAQRRIEAGLAAGSLGTPTLVIGSTGPA